MHDLLSVLCENASLERLDWSPPMEDLCKATIGGGPVFGGLKRAWNLVKLMATMKPYADCCQVPVADTSISYVDLPTKTVTATVYADLDRTTTAALIRACRAHGTTVTAAVGAALVQTVGSVSAAANDQADRAKDGSLLPVVMFCGADTRRRYEPELARHHLAYHVSGVPPYHFNMAAGENAQKASLWRVTSEIRAEWMAALQRRVPIIFGNLIGDMWGNIYTMKVRWCWCWCWCGCVCAACADDTLAATLSSGVRAAQVQRQHQHLQLGCAPLQADLRLVEPRHSSTVGEHVARAAAHHAGVDREWRADRYHPGSVPCVLARVLGCDPCWARREAVLHGGISGWGAVMRGLGRNINIFVRTGCGITLHEPLRRCRPCCDF